MQTFLFSRCTRSALLVLAACGGGDASVVGSGAADAGLPHGDPNAAHLYTTVSSSNELLAIDPQTHAVVQHIPVGAGPAIAAPTCSPF